MDFIKAIIAIIVAFAVTFIIFWIKDHYYDGGNRRKIVRDPFFMPENIMRYYKACAEILSPYLELEECRLILNGAKKELQQNYKQYKYVIKENLSKETYRYYIDVCEDSEYHGYIYRNWAYLYINLSIKYVRSPLCTNTSNAQAFCDFKEHVDTWYKKIISGETTCPKSFIEQFNY